MMQQPISEASQLAEEEVFIQDYIKPDRMLEFSEMKRVYIYANIFVYNVY